MVPGRVPVRRSPARPRWPARVLTNTGRFAEAEDVLLAIPRGRDAEGTLVRQALELLYRVEGRNREVRELILESWADAPDPGYVLRRLYLLDDSAFPVDYVKQALSGGDPEDDRVWLGRANLAIWLGQLDEAGRWLDACVARRPEDPAVWSARLDLGAGVGGSRPPSGGPWTICPRAGSGPARSGGSAAGSPRGSATTGANAGSCMP